MRRLLPLLALLAAALLAGCGGSGSGGSSKAPLRDATLMLDFTPNAVHAGIYSAVARRYDRAAGVRLHVEIPGSSTDSVKLLLSGRADFAVLDIHDLALADAQGRGLVGVMAVEQRPLAAVLASRAVDSPRALEGRKVGVTGLPSDDAVLRSIVAGAGGNPKRVKLVTIGFNAVPALLGGRVAGATAFWNVEGVALRAKRPGTHVFRVDAYGAPHYPELVLTTTRTELGREPALVRATVAALVRGYGVTVRTPVASLTDLQRQVAGLDRGELERQLAVLGPAFDPPGSHIGALDPAVLRTWARWEARFGIVKHVPVVSRLFDTSVAHG